MTSILNSRNANLKRKKSTILVLLLATEKYKWIPKKLRGIMDWPIPKTPTDIQKFLGFTGYYQYFVQGYSKIACPLLDLTKKAIIWEWGEQQHKAFKELKTCMCSRT